MIKWIKAVLLSDYSPSIICLFLLIKMDFTILSNWPQNQTIDNRIKLALLFIHLVIMLVVLSPAISILLSKIDNEKINAFITLPSPDKNITYIDFYDFLSGIALSAFYLSVLLYTIKDVYDAAGWIISGMYIFLLFVASISIAAMSLMRFVWLFTRYNKYSYLFISLFSGGLCMAVLGVAMRMTS